MAWMSLSVPSNLSRTLRRCSCPANRFLSSKTDDLSLTSSDKYQLLQKSPVKTDLYQRSLPRLPIPKLKKTCERYLASQKALLDNTSFKATEDVVS
jgi:hypothetical protein